MAINQLGGATWTNPLALPGSKTVNATNKTTPVTSNTGTKQVVPGAKVYNPMPAYSAPAATTQWTDPGGGDGGGGGDQTITTGGGQAAPVWVDPYSNTVFGSTENFNRVHGDWTSQRDATMGSITDRINNDYDGYNSAVQDFDANTRMGQTRINDQYVQNELSKIQGGRGVQDMVGTGVRSAGVVLANKPGASTSSAGEGVARAYGQVGAREMTKVNNQAAQGKHAIDLDQAEFNEEVTMDARHLSENKTRIVNDIATETAGKIASLNAAAASASLSDRLDIEGEKARVRNEALARLSTLDQRIQGIQGSAKPSDPNSWNATATAMANDGVAANNPFDFQTGTPAEFAGTGQFEGPLPLFRRPMGRDER